jgi:serine/threonine protein kinase
MEHPRILGLSEWRQLARGGLAVVWEARQLSLNRLVAVKVYQRELDESGRRHFLREATAAGRLSDHPGIVSVYDAGVLVDGRPYLIMEQAR